MITCNVQKLAMSGVTSYLKFVSFLENDMDGDALSLAFAAQSGPDCLKDVVPKYGLRLKVYQAIKVELEAQVTMHASCQFQMEHRHNPKSLLLVYHSFQNFCYVCTQ